MLFDGGMDCRVVVGLGLVVAACGDNLTVPPPAPRGQGSEATSDLVIKTAKEEVPLPGTLLLEMPRQPPPGDNGGMGWPLDAILQKAGVTKYEKLICTDSKGTNLTLEKQDLDPKIAMPFVKLNRQGSLRFIVFKKTGETWTRGGDLRELTRVLVVK